MKKIWVPVVVLWLLPASYSLQRPAEPPENVQTAYEDSIRSQTQEAGETILYFPDYVDGGGWSVQLALSNVDPDTGAEVAVEVYDEDGGPVPDLFDSGLTFEIPPLGSRVLRSVGTGAIRRGWIQVRTGADSVSGLLTYREGRTGIEVSVEPAELGERFALFVEESDDVGAGVAVFKPEMASGIQLRVRDEEGNDPLEGAFVSRGNFHQLARTLPEWFTAEGIDRGFLSDFQGLLFLRAEDESPFAPLGLRFGKRSQSLSSVPAIRDETQEPMETTLYFPDYVDGSGWSVQLALSNIDAATAAEVSVEVFDEDGRTVRDLFDAGSAFRIPSLGSRVLKSAGAGAIRRGWIEVESDSAAVSGLLTYRQSESGVEVSVKPVELGSQFALFVEETSAVGAGVAIFKPDAAPNIELRIRDEDGNDPLNGVFIPRGDFHQLARTLPEWLGAGGVDTGFLSDFRGLLFIRSEDESQFAPLGLRFGKTNASLSSVPAIRILDGEGIGGGQAPPPTVTLSVAPSSIDWGDSATLTWSSTNAVSAEIAPDIGTVAASGSRKVSPRATTTYRITVRGAGGRTQTASVAVRVVVSELAALTALYEFAGGTNWTDSANWGTGRPLGTWHGVEVDGQGRVTGLFLNANGLSGEFPPELSALTHLRSLDLRDNALTGPIPPKLGSLANLTYLGLANNDLTGLIPPDLGALSDLTSLGLANNRLTGPIPAELGELSNLTYLGLASNNLTGSIPSALGALTNLTSLSLQRNLLTGPIPTALSSLSNLVNLDLRDNGLTGPIPPHLGSLANVELIRLGENYLEGPIPPQLGSLANLKDLQLDQNDLTGPIPPQLGSAANLTAISLRGNALTGRIPPQLGSLADLAILDLGGNPLTGPIPPDLGSLANLRFLLLTSTRLNGPLPDSFLGMDLDVFWFDSKEDLCIPGNADFVAWSKGIENFNAGAFCNDSDRAALEAFFEIAGGSDWTNSDGWGGDEPLEEWYGVSVDSQGRVTGLDLSANGLEGRIASNLGGLSQMTELRIGGNALSGRLPLSLSLLPALQEFDYGDTQLCVPTEESFRAWIGAVPSQEGTAADCPAPSDRDVLLALYDATGGPNWTNRENWLTNRPLEDWHGVDVDEDGHVAVLNLSNNNLTGRIPPELGALSKLQHLWLPANGLTGSIPPELGSLANLTNIYLAQNRLTGPIPPELGSLSKLSWLVLRKNDLTGSIPPELGSLANLEILRLEENALTGSIPPGLGALSKLEFVWLADNALTGSIPRELGALPNLKFLWLQNNNLTGPIPPELGSLAHLSSLNLGDNDLTGSIPPELGELARLEYLRLHGNDLSGAVPAAIGGLENLRSLVFARNGRLSGTLPGRLTDLRRLEDLLAADTNLCAPSDARFLDWISGIVRRRVVICGDEEPPAVILAQAVQSRDHPVPLVAGEEALLRVFLESKRDSGANFPPVRVTFYRNGSKTYVADIPGQSAPIPRQIDEGDLTASANAQIPGWVVQPGLEMVIDVDPEGTLGPDPEVKKRIPETGRLAVEVRTMPVFELTAIPFIWTQSPDSSLVETVASMAQDPGGHPLLSETRTLLPINELDVKAHAPVRTSTNNAQTLLNETEIIRVMEGASGHYIGLTAGDLANNVAGIAKFAGRSSFSEVAPSTMAHELGHNFGLYHAPCGNPAFLEISYPGNTGSIGDWGYDLREPGRLLPPVWSDLMSYCRIPSRWIGSYHFTNALRFRLHNAGRGEGSALVAAPTKSLLLWGGADSAGKPFLEPAFVAAASAELPRSPGEFEIVGRDGDGEELFSLSFEMPEVADGDGGSSFVFALPVQAGWAEELASITLSGPGGTVRLDGETDRPVTILRDPGTGEIRGILRGVAGGSGSGDDAVSALAVEPGVEVLTSRGIPEAEDWRR